MGVFENEQETTAYQGAGGLCASKEESGCRDDEVFLMEFSIGVRIFLYMKKELKSWELEALIHM